MQMDRRSYSITKMDLECMLDDEAADPKPLPLSLLNEITNGFSDEQEIGRGGFAVVYRGKLANRIVAVKSMSNTYMHEEVFQREVASLMIVKHENIVRFLGYCADTQGTMVRHEGQFIMAEVQQRLLCFEYLPNGSLDKHITDTSSPLHWRDRYHIIKGICQGLCYLHQKNIVHLDLKPANILLGEKFVAKIADFGLSRSFRETQSRAFVTNIGGTLGYLAPEFSNREITYKFDIYSLGVIVIEILTGKKGYYVVDKVVESWSKKLESHSYVQLEQVRVCAEIGIECMSFNPEKRPDAQDLINRLDEMEKYIETCEITSQHVEYAPNELHQDIPNAPGEASSEKNGTAVIAWTNPYNVFWKNIANLNKFNETMNTLDPDIRRCLQYCIIFPKGSKLRMGELVLLWIAQGFVKTGCATKDMEDVAEGYIRELVTCSFLQPIETVSGPGFRIPDVLHDLLDKVVRNCFRIQNAPFNKKQFSLKKKGIGKAISRGGECWEGHVPRDIQHLFVQNYDGELITEKILGLKDLHTLIIYVVEEDTPVEEKIIESICKRLPELRVLAVAFSQEHHLTKQANNFSVPESISQLKHLRYLAFRTRCSRMVLPSVLSKLHHIQTLDFGDGRILEFTSTGLVNLRHIFCLDVMKFPHIGRLNSLQNIPTKFCIRNEQGYEIKQLRNLNKLQGSLEIGGLENVKSKEEALEANLSAKKQLRRLTLSWGDDSDTRCTPDVEVEVLEGLCPPVGLETLRILDYDGSSYPDWMVGKQNGGPKNLQQLEFVRLIEPGPIPDLFEAFPRLRVLQINDCLCDALPGNMEQLTSLKKLKIVACSQIRWLPRLPRSLEEFDLAHCNNEFMESCKTVGHLNWQKIEHIPKKLIHWHIRKTVNDV